MNSPNRLLAKEKLMLALDLDNRETAEQWVAKLKSHVGYFKIGLQLFTKEGADLIRSIRKRGGRIFLDVKYHDIPTTVRLACEAACTLGVDFINVHALGGKSMIREAARGLRESSSRMRSPRPKLLAVTILTSHDAKVLKQELGLRLKPQNEVVRLAKMAKSAGADGIVCSALEAGAVRQACGEAFIIITPGIRPGGLAKGDQRRVMTPAKAIQAGSNYLVVGRPIMQAADPVAAAKSVVLEIDKALHLLGSVKKVSKIKKKRKKK